MLDLMTSSRKVRTTKVRVCAYFALILLVCALAALYANARLQYEEIQKSYHLCKQEKETLSTQLQVTYDYKQRLDKSLKAEKSEHQRTKSELEGKLNDEKAKYEKIIGEEKLRFSTLQQHHNILQTHDEDLKEECSKTKREQLDEINALQSKLKEVQEELKKSENDKDNSIAHLKTQNEHLQMELSHLKEELIKLKRPDDKEYNRTETTGVNFSKQIKDGNSHYVVVTIKSSSPRSEINLEKANLAPIPKTSSTTKRSTPKESRFNHLPAPIGIGAGKEFRDSIAGSIDNSVENEMKANRLEKENQANEVFGNNLMESINQNGADEDDDPEGIPIPNEDPAERN